MRLLIGVLTVSVLAGACGGDDADTTESANGSVTRAETRVEAAETAVNDAEAAFTNARDAFCTESEALIDVLDRYGGILDEGEVTVGDVRTGATDLQQSRTAAGASADAAIEANEQLVAANEELTAAVAELEAARLADASNSADEDPSAAETATTATTAPPVPDDIAKRVEKAESEFSDAADDVDDTTPLNAATVQLASAAYAVEFAWLQLFASAGCLDDEQRAEAVAAVAEYTAALQADLQVAGYYTGEVDGVYGPETVAAVEQLQEAAGLPVTGLVDGPTERALETAVQAGTDVAAAEAANHNAAIQGALKVLGYWDGPVDGEWSDELGAAVAELQRDLGIEPTGVVDPATLHALEAALEASETPLTTTTSSSTASTGSAPPGTSD
jgi:murein L,D-transpeptidase YcbB/YkuD